ncbi:MAG: hypothetical protein BMS9Abin08_1625 [Gammaproteobacteria bacterium]|nr:MAG: hypothetical protein BMS9Abin08_1625 [Gammaproteobacteria bacterium]
MASLDETVKRLEHEKRVLLEIGSMLVSELDPNKLLSRVAEKTQQLIKAKTVLIPLVSEERSSYTYVAGCGENADEIVGESMPMDTGICGWVWKHKCPWWHGVLDDLEPHERNKWEKEAGTVIMVPLIGKKHFWGGIAGINKDGADEFDKADLDLLTLLAQQVAIAIENAYMFNDLETTVARRTRQLEQARIQAESANKMKSEFLANMSHEIRTPLTAIIGFGESILESGQSMEERLEAVRIIIRSGKHLSQLINGILDLSKIEADQITVESITLPLLDVLEEVDNLASLQAAGKGLAFGINYNWPLPCCITSDPLRLKQILLNLCSNAVKFTHQGSVSIFVSCTAENEQMQFVISDTGIGITPEQQTRLFRQFSQADVSTTRKYGGTGLGLFISKQLAEKLGGTLTVESKAGEGSHFTLAIATGPLEDVEWIEGTHKATETKTESGPIINQLTGQILLAEDTVFNQQLITHLIKRTGCSVTVVENGRQTVEQALAGDYDLLLMDIQMPVMGGLEATQKLREQGYSVPIVALTANVMTHDVENYLAAGCDAFLAKPIEQQQFYKTLGAYLQETETTIDDSPITTQCDNDDSFLMDMVGRFIDSLDERLKRARQYTDELDWSSLKRETHDLKGMGGNFGFPQMTRLAGTMEFEMTKEAYNEVRRSMFDLEQLGRRIILGRPKN